MILIIDDHTDTRYALARILLLEGYDATAVASAEEAQPILESRKPALIIIDYNMPGIDGLTYLSQIRRDKRLCDVPVIMFSAADKTLQHNAMQAGASAYIVKGSLDWADLRREIHRLAGPPARAQLPSDAKPRRTRDVG